MKVVPLLKSHKLFKISPRLLVLILLILQLLRNDLCVSLIKPN